MCKGAVTLNKGIRQMMKIGKRGTMHVELNRNGDVTSMEWKRSCYCLSRGLIKDTDHCPEHLRPIFQDSRRRTLEKLIDG